MENQQRVAASADKGSFQENQISVRYRQLKRAKSAFAKLHFRLIRKMRQASHDFGLLEDGDRIAVAVSGGKDSLTLLRLLDL